MSWRTYVYFLRPVGTDGPIKIGVSRDPAGRLRDYMKWSPVPLEIAAKIEATFKAERQFHALFYQHHSHHEWFSAAPEITATIDTINDGTFDLATLPRGRNLFRGGPAAEAEAREWSSIASRMRWIRQRGVAIPADVRAAENAWSCEPDEKARRRAIVREFVLSQATPTQTGAAAA
jgi:hypothetical protein